jgi:hypothetical protein
MSRMSDQYRIKISVLPFSETATKAIAESGIPSMEEDAETLDFELGPLPWEAVMIAVEGMGENSDIIEFTITRVSSGLE